VRACIYLPGRREPLEAADLVARRTAKRAKLETELMSPDGNKKHLCNYTAMARAASARLGLAQPFTADDIRGVTVSFEGTGQHSGVKSVDQAKLAKLLKSRGVTMKMFRGALFVDVLGGQLAQHLLKAHIARVEGKAEPVLTSAAAPAEAGEEDAEEEDEDAEEDEDDASDDVDSDADAVTDGFAVGKSAKADAGDETDDDDTAHTTHMCAAGLEEAHSLFIDRTASVDTPFLTAATSLHAAGLSAAPSAVTSAEGAAGGAPLFAALSATPSLRGMMLLNEHPELLGALSAAPSAAPMFGGPSPAPPGFTPTGIPAFQPPPGPPVELSATPSALAFADGVFGAAPSASRFAGLAHAASGAAGPHMARSLSSRGASGARTHGLRVRI
jgi:ribosomal protein L12E/L44/L45/RPP1/RPP2